MIGMAVGLWVTFPLWLIAAAALSPILPGRWRALRLLWLFVVYVSCESVLLVVLLGLWLASGFGRRIRTPYFEGIHYDLAQGLLWVLFGEARRVLALRIETDGPSPDAHPGTPLIVACRHAGPGDSLILIHALMDWYAREPRVVLKNTLAWDPMIDVILHRIPARFISANPRRGEDLESQIADLARDLDENDAFVIFPEGGNFTPERRRRAIDRLRRDRRHRQARQAERMEHVLPPKPGGALAALAAHPGIDVVFAAHTGLGHETFPAELWRRLPSDETLTMRMWLAPAADRPTDPDEQVDWLFGWWKRLDDWIEAEGRE
jgi:1-acyl-sn-glycerol-3-phosphate acyltransferase